MSGGAIFTADDIARAFLAACDAELRALKPGNVHVHAGGHGMAVEQFERAAAAAAPHVADAGQPVGRRILRAVAASLAAAGCNTNLGILLLCVPLAEAAFSAHFSRGGPASDRPGAPNAWRSPLPLPAPAPPGGGEGSPLRAALRQVLDGLSPDDAVNVFRAIASANPGGLGESAEADVAQPPRIPLRQAMAIAATRDRIARAYVTAFEDVFEVALPLLDEARAGLPSDELAVTALHMGLLAAFPDSHIARKYGAAVAEDVRGEARRLVHLIRPRLAAGAVDELGDFDRRLKERGLNPGTTADFVVATLFAAQLEARLSSAISAT